MESLVTGWAYRGGYTKCITSATSHPSLFYFKTGRFALQILASLYMFNESQNITKDVSWARHHPDCDHNSVS